MRIQEGYVLDPKEMEELKPAYLNIRKVRIGFVPAQLEEVVPGVKGPIDVVVRSCSRGLEYGDTQDKITMKDLETPLLIEKIEPLRCPVNDMRYIRTQKVVLAVCQVTGSKLGSCLGQAVCLLNNVSLSRYESVKTMLERGTHPVGEITFEIRLSL